MAYTIIATGQWGQGNDHSKIYFDLESTKTSGSVVCKVFIQDVNGGSKSEIWSGTVTFPLNWTSEGYLVSLTGSYSGDNWFLKTEFESADSEFTSSTKQVNAYTKYPVSYGTPSVTCNTSPIPATGGSYTLVSSCTQQINYSDGSSETKTMPTTFSYQYSTNGGVAVVPMGWSLSPNGVITASNNTVESVKTAQLTVRCTSHGKTGTANVTVEQSAGSKVYGTPSVSQFSYADFAASGGTKAPTVSYSQTWTWNGVSGSGGTVTSGGTLTFSTSGTLPSGFTKAGDYSTSGKVTWAGRGTTTGDARDAKSYLKVKVTINGNTSSLKTCTSCKQVANSLTWGDLGTITHTTPVSLKAAGQTYTMSPTISSQTGTYTSGSTTTYSPVFTYAVTTSKTGYSLSGGTVTVTNNTTTSARNGFKVRITATGNGSKTATKDITFNQPAGSKTYSTPVVSSFSYADFTAAGGEKTPTVSYSQTWTWNGVSGSGETVTSGGTLAFSTSGTRPSGLTLSGTYSTTGKVSWASRGTVTGSARNANSYLKVTVTVNGVSSNTKACDSCVQAANSLSSLSMSSDKTAIKIGESVGFSVMASYTSGSSGDVTGLATYSQSTSGVVSIVKGDTFTVTSNLTNCIMDGDSYAVSGGTYSASVYPYSGYEMSTVTVKMGGTNITGSAYSNGNINISNVTGNIVVTASASISEQTQYFSVTTNLERCTISPVIGSVATGNSYSATVTAEGGYAIGYTSIIMGETDITSSSYSNGNISIPSVTGNIHITVSATSTDQTGGLLGDADWFNGYWSASGSSATRTTSNSYLTCYFIELPAGNWIISPKSISGYSVGIRPYVCRTLSGTSPQNFTRSTAVYGDVGTAVGQTLSTDTIRSLDSSASYFAICLYANSNSGGSGLNLSSKTYDELITVTRDESSSTASVTSNLVNCSISPDVSSVPMNGSYSAVVTADSGYVLDSVTVTMGGTAVSVSGGTISIPNVTGNIVINASASAEGGSEAGLFDGVGWRNILWNVNQGTASASQNFLTSDFFILPEGNYTIETKPVSGYMVKFRAYGCDSFSGNSATGLVSLSAFGEGTSILSTTSDYIKGLASAAGKTYVAIGVWAVSGSTYATSGKDWDDLLEVTPVDSGYESYASVTNTLKCCTISPLSSSVPVGESYSATITPDSGYTLDTVSVTMAGTPVPVSGGTISIPSVTGDIVINAEATPTLVTGKYWYAATVGSADQGIKPNSGFVCTAERLACSEGDTFIVTGHGGSQNSRLWAFLDSSRIVLSIAGSGENATNKTVTAPAGAAYFIYTANKSYTYSVRKG